MRTHKPVSRRRLLKAAAGFPLIVPASALGRGGAAAPSDRVTMAGLGIGSRGARDLQSFLSLKEVQFLAICDVRNERREAIKSIIDQKNGNRDCAMYSDQYELWARKDIDALLIATGDRWHALLSIGSARAGKDVYCEKPCSMTIAESRALADTFLSLNRIYQAGTQRRNGPNFVHAVEMARGGKLGKLTALHAEVGPGNRWPPKTTHAWLPGEPEPPKQVVDWDRWLGPSPWRPYNSQYIQGRWRGYFDFHGGGVLEWGSHTVDLCQWAAGADAVTPVEFDPRGMGQNTPYSIDCRYAGGLRLMMRDSGFLGLGSCHVRFEGDAGWVETADGGKIEVSENLRGERLEVSQAEAQAATTNHARNFVECVKSRKQPRSNALAACQTHIACHAAYIAFQLGRKLKFDPAADSFIGDEQANRMRSRAMREPWRV
ncbi:MAG TPA: Gfo/Idh/MocA family oxidoreductase [Bryobacteraceae bacterium]|jgi:predicted dehydrogenase|nr:Gfo/Idh/MocA family oxidoreductase [Bryobacteraceae bacterium]